jgi:hypothetical protein
MTNNVVLLLWLLWLYGAKIAASSNTAHDKCSWLSPDLCNTDKPVLGLAFIHMRKAGGTNINAIVKKWLVVRGCAPSSIVAHQVYGTYGITKGLPILLNLEEEKQYSQLCPHVDFSHNEYSCVNGRGILDHALLNRSNDRKEHFSILTTLRNPLERLGSQAFYRNGPGFEYLNRITREMCGPSNGQRKKCAANGNKLPVCDCLDRATEATKVALRSSDNEWLAWANKSYADPNNFMGDNYAANYYIRRLIKEPLDKKEYPGLANCLERHPTKCNPQFMSTLPALSAFAHRIHCVLAPKGQPEAPIDIIEGLAIAKKLLENHIDFIITEQMNTPAAHRVLRRVLHDPSYDPPATKVNAGAIAISRKKVSYTEYMSPAVIEYFRRDNAQDIELYNFAVGLFEEREKTGDL